MSIHDDLKIMHQSHDYSGICTIYDQFEDICDIQPSEWDFIYLMNGLYKFERYNDCLSLYKKCKKLYKESDKLNVKMGWCVYHLFLKRFDFDNSKSSDFFEKVNYVLKNVSDGQYSPVWCIVNLATKAIVQKKTGNNPDYALANDYLNQVDPQNLSRNEKQGTAENGKKISMASDCETWYGRKSKCLFEMKSWGECIKICEDGLATITNFHNNNDCWFKYRIGYSRLEQGMIEGSLSVAKEILESGFRHWSIYQLLYDISVANADAYSAMKYAGYCALADQSHEMRIKFYEEYAFFLSKQGMSDKAMLHLHLIILIKQEKEWKLKEEKQWKIDGKIAKLDRAGTLKLLRHFWAESRDKDKVYIEGAVSKILPSGKDGFITDTNGKEYYFSFRDAYCNRSKLVIGVKVMFVTGKRLDRKKNIWKDNAIEVKLK